MATITSAANWNYSVWWTWVWWIAPVLGDIVDFIDKKEEEERNDEKMKEEEENMNRPLPNSFIAELK